MIPAMEEHEIGEVIHDAQKAILEAIAWIKKAPHLAGCAVTRGRIMGKDPVCTCGRDELVGRGPEKTLRKESLGKPS